MELREAAQMALDYLDAPSSKVWAAGTQYKIIQALRAALAQPEREWVGLTDEEREAIDKWIEFKEAGGNEPVPAQKLVTYVESKLREKNSG